MWVSGGGDRAAWFSFKFKKGMLIEGALRDFEGHAQGTMLLEVEKAISLDDKGHWVIGNYVEASDPHMRWWMTEGDGSRMAKGGHYHFCEGASLDCKVSRRGQSIHLERFRRITQKEVDNQVPGWAFKAPMKRSFMAYLKSKDIGEAEELPEAELPWKEDEDSSEVTPSTEEDKSEDLKAMLKKARDEVAKIEKRLQKPKEKEAKKDGKEAKVKEKAKIKEGDTKGKEKKKRSPSKSPPKARGSEKKKKDKKKKKKKKKADESSSEEDPKAKKKKGKGKRRKSSSSSSSSESDDPKLFGEPTPPAKKVKKGHAQDRGPFGGGDAVDFHGEVQSEEEEGFQNASAVHKVSNQVKLAQYAKKNPGRLASRMLLKMAQESARGIVGAAMEGNESLTPPIAVHYLITMLIPQLGTRLNMRTQRELRTLCTALDMLARGEPAHAADLITQRVKALEKATQDTHWGSAQYLELLSPEAGGLLDRAEEVYLNREYLLELKLKGMDKAAPRGQRSDQKGGQAEKGGKKGKEKGKGKGGGDKPPPKEGS